MIWDDLDLELAKRRDQGLLRTRRTLQSPAGPHAIVDGRPLLAFCSNDYLGLAADPTVAAALAQGAKRWGAGSGASAGGPSGRRRRRGPPAHAYRPPVDR